MFLGGGYEYLVIVDIMIGLVVLYRYGEIQRYLLVLVQRNVKVVFFGFNMM